MTTALFRLSLISVAVALALSGCGGTNKRAKERCLRDASNRSDEAVVEKRYEAGKLGTRKQIERELGVPGRPGSSFFDANGHLRPYDSLDLAHKNQLVIWMNTGRVGELTFDARMRARTELKPDC